jgi:hypothetical protein
MKVKSRGGKFEQKQAQRLKNAYFELEKNDKIASVLLTSIVPYRKCQPVTPSKESHGVTVLGKAPFS